MASLHLVAYFFGGLFLTNAVPHLGAALSGRPFQSPFAKPPGEGLSTSRVNALWGFANLVVGYLLLWQVGSFNLHDLGHAGALGLAILLGGLFLARAFGRFNGGDHPV